MISLIIVFYLEITPSTNNSLITLFLINFFICFPLDFGAIVDVTNHQSRFSCTDQLFSYFIIAY